MEWLAILSPLGLPLLVGAVTVGLSAALYFILRTNLRETSFEEAIQSQRTLNRDLFGERKPRKNKKKEDKKPRAGPPVVPKKTEDTTLLTEQQPVVPLPPPQQEVEKEIIPPPAPVAPEEPSSSTAAGPVVGSTPSHTSRHVELNPEPIILEDETKVEVVLSRRRSSATLKGLPGKSILHKKDEDVSSSPTPPPPPDDSLPPVSANHFEIRHPKDDKELHEHRKEEKRKKSKKPRPEFLIGLVEDADTAQELVQALLDKFGGGQSTEQWQGSKLSTLASLKSKLAEATQLLANEQSNNQSLQLKLRELRTDLSAERTKAANIRKALEEAVGNKNQEIQSLSLRLQQVTQLSGQEKGNLQTQIKQLHGTLQTLTADLKKELGQKGDLEREAEALRVQCCHLEAQLNSSFQSNADLSAKVRFFEEELSRAEEKFQEVRRQDEQVWLNDLDNKLHSQSAGMLAEISALRESLMERESEKGKLEEAKEKAVQEVEAMKRQMEEAKEKAAQEVEAMKRQLETQMAELSATKDQLAFLQTSGAQKEEATREWQKKTEGLEHTVENLQTKLKSTEQRLAEEMAAKDESSKVVEEVKRRLQTQGVQILDETTWELLIPPPPESEEKIKSMAAVMATVDSQLQLVERSLREKEDEWREKEAEFQARIQEMEAQLAKAAVVNGDNSHSRAQANGGAEEGEGSNPPSPSPSSTSSSPEKKKTSKKVLGLFSKKH